MAKKRTDWIVIGISGVTCGGKTSLAVNLMNALYPSYLYHQDHYFYPDESPKHVKCETLNHNNYEVLSSLDMEAMTKDVVATINGESSGHKWQLEKSPGVHTIEGKKILILEGFTILNYRPLYELCDLKYYFVLSYEECLARRIHREYDPPDIEGYFEECVWPEHVKARAQVENDKSVTKLHSNENAFEIVMADLRQLGAIEITD